ncbi:hypothetical protein MA16_Dca014170 [Dendrobium catenatum]|uniref:Uncharacterized protein n=1 Tax=Dendrobium catenatum TaxID=906689 RepID=A0A2I0VTL4_9ASPA|nr:hypothetical protein MA16_Dca014170 [Dendrobium catenatum]
MTRSVSELQRRRSAAVELVDEVIRLYKEGVAPTEMRARQSLKGLYSHKQRDRPAEDRELSLFFVWVVDSNFTVFYFLEFALIVNQNVNELCFLLKAKRDATERLTAEKMEEVDNQVVRTWGERRMEAELVEKIDITDMKRDMLDIQPVSTKKLVLMVVIHRTFLDHQFKKVEQSSPCGSNQSWEVHEQSLSLEL